MHVDAISPSLSVESNGHGSAPGGEVAAEMGQSDVEIVNRDGAEADGELIVDGNGERQPKAIRRPNAPTKAQIAEHYPAHAHYRSWCPDCVAGRSLCKQHRRQDIDVDDSLGPVISLDYGFTSIRRIGERSCAYICSLWS